MYQGLAVLPILFAADLTLNHFRLMFLRISMNPIILKTPGVNGRILSSDLSLDVAEAVVSQSRLRYVHGEPNHSESFGARVH